MRQQLTIALVFFSCAVSKAQTFDSKELIGVWQNMADTASEWNADMYRFYANGKFAFYYNVMMCDKRTLSYFGTWQVTKTNKLKLIVESKNIVKGGKLVPALGLCASEYTIEGGNIIWIRLKKIEILNIQLSSITIDNENRNLKTLTFDKKRFWKFDDDPTKYY